MSENGVRRAFVADSEIHASILESLASAEHPLRLSESPVGAAVLITQSRDLDAALLEEAGQTLEAVVLLEPAEASIAETSVPIHRLENASLTGVAEHTVLLMLALGKQLPWVLEQTRQRAWTSETAEPRLTSQRDYAYNWVGLEGFGTLAGRTIGLVGLGTIGTATAKMLRGFSTNVLYHKPTRLARQRELELNVRWVDLDTLLTESDYVSLHHRFVEGAEAVEGNDEQFARRQFELMKPTAFFVNTARGRLVDEDALCDAIESGQIAGAALDVFRYEPLPADHRFFDLPRERMIITPHLAGVPMREAADTVVRQIAGLLDPTRKAENNADHA